MPELPKMYPVWADAENRRLFGMDNDEEGALWFSSGIPKLHRYQPRTGEIDTIPLPEGHGGSECVCVGGKVYLLPQANPRITIYQVAEDRVVQVDKPFLEANIWNGRKDLERGLIYMSERSRPCLVVWDVEDDRGDLFPYPEAGSLPSIRETGWPDRLAVFDVPGDPYLPRRRVYFDPDERCFVAEDTEPIPPLRPGTEDEAERYLIHFRAPGSTYPHIREARLICLDRLTGERRERELPGWGTEFGFVGGGSFYKGWQLNPVDTYRTSYKYDERTGKMTPLVENPHLGTDGLPYHFLNWLMAYHPETDTFDRLLLDVPEGRYPQLCYSKVVGDQLYFTANDIWSKEKGRSLGASEGPVGQVMVLQSHPLEK